MYRRIRAHAHRVLVLFVVSFAAFAGVSHDPSLHWRTLHTPHFAIHFHDRAQDTAEKVAAIAERSHARLTERFDWPAERTDIVISDASDIPNGNATPLPGNRVNLLVVPPDAINSLEANDGWLESVV